MKNNRLQKLTLDQPANYLIRIPGVLDRQWLDWNGGMVVEVDINGNDPITILSIAVDQAGLQGLLRYLYSLGIPLISVVCQDCP